MSGLSILSAFNKLSLICPIQRNIRNITVCKPNLFHSTPALCAEPMKKKRKMDPNLTKLRDERKKKKLEKQIKRLEKHALQMKPLEELEVPLTYLENKPARVRPVQALSPEKLEEIVLLKKEWAEYLRVDYMNDVQMIDRIEASQTKALEALKEVSEDLYEAAIQTDVELVPYIGKGPVATPPIKNYDSPDGEYVDITKKWLN